MTITYPVSMPSNNLQSITISMSNAVAVSESAFSFQQQVVDLGGDGWMIEFNPPPMTRETADQWKAFLLSLRGRFGTFYAGDPAGINPRGSWGGTPLVNGGGQTGRTLAIDGLTTSVTGICKRGDWIQLGTGSGARLYMVVADANSNGSGQATLDIVPSLRTSPSDNATVIKTNAVGVFRLLENTVSWSVDSDKIYRLSFKAFEVI